MYTKFQSTPGDQPFPPFHNSVSGYKKRDLPPITKAAVRYTDH